MRSKEWETAVGTLDWIEADTTVTNYRRLETVLVIEDHEDLNRALSLRLEKAGLNVASAYDGLAGLEKIQVLEPDLIVLDLNLPRLHGFKLLHRLRNQKNLHEAPIIVMTGDVDPEVETRTERWGIEKIFRKPIDQKEIVRAVLETLEQG